MTDGKTYAIHKNLDDALQEVTAELEQAEARIEELEAENERLLDEAVEAVMSAAENMVYTATKRNGDRKLRFDAFEVEAELKGAAEYYASAIRALKKGGDA